MSKGSKSEMKENKKLIAWKNKNQLDEKKKEIR